MSTFSTLPSVFEVLADIGFALLIIWALSGGNHVRSQSPDRAHPHGCGPLSRKPWILKKRMRNGSGIESRPTLRAFDPR